LTALAQRRLAAFAPRRRTKTAAIEKIKRFFSFFAP